MRQKSLADEGFEKYRKTTRREQFLHDMDQIIPWSELAAAIEPFYPKPKGAGRRPIGIERMLRIHFLQHWFNLSDPAVEESLRVLSESLRHLPRSAEVRYPEALDRPHQGEPGTPQPHKPMLFDVVFSYLPPHNHNDRCRALT